MRQNDCLEGDFLEDEYQKANLAGQAWKEVAMETGEATLSAHEDH